MPSFIPQIFECLSRGGMVLSKHVLPSSLWFCLSLSLENSSPRNSYGLLPHSFTFLFCCELRRAFWVDCAYSSKQATSEHFIFKACRFFPCIHHHQTCVLIYLVFLSFTQIWAPKGHIHITMVCSTSLFQTPRTLPGT